MPKGNTLIVCGTLIILACLGAITYLISTDRPTEVAIGLVSPILIAVIGTVYNSAKLDGLSKQADDIHAEVNGKLTDKMARAVNAALDEREATKAAKDAEGVQQDGP